MSVVWSQWPDLTVSPTLTASLIFVDRLTLVVSDGATLLAVRGLALLLRHGDTLVLALLVSGTAVLARPGGGQRSLRHNIISKNISVLGTKWRE